MRYLFLLLVLLGGSLASAQTPALTPQPDSLVAAHQAVASDTAAAIHRLFAAKRRQSAAVIGGTVGVGLLGYLVAEGTRHSYNDYATPLAAAGISLLTIPITVVEIGYYRQFTRRKEKKALDAFTIHKLPARIKRQLQPVYFQ